MSKKLIFTILLTLLFGYALGNSAPKKSEPANQVVNQNQTTPIITPSVQSATTISSSAAELNKTLYLVTKVVDGDTIAVDINGKKEVLRLIGIDSPETVDPRKPVQCFGIEASNKAKGLLTNKKVYLENDPSQDERDKYSRLLRYVFLENGTNFNKLMISEGYAHEYTYQLPYKYQTEFKEAEKYARENKIGLWADNACPVSQKVTPNPTLIPIKTTVPTITTTPIQQAQPQTGFSCAGKTTCGQMISCAEANYYLNNCGVSRLDGDKDGVPCETLCR